PYPPIRLADFLLILSVLRMYKVRRTGAWAAPSHTDAFKSIHTQTRNLEGSVMLSWILDNLVFVIATVTIVALIIVFVGCRFVWYRRLSRNIGSHEDRRPGLHEPRRPEDTGAAGPGRRCSKGHSLDPSWDSCPYCEAEQRSKEKTGGLGTVGEPEEIE